MCVFSLYFNVSSSVYGQFYSYVSLVDKACRIAGLAMVYLLYVSIPIKRSFKRSFGCRCSFFFGFGTLLSISSHFFRGSRHETAT